MPQVIILKSLCLKPEDTHLKLFSADLYEYLKPMGFKKVKTGDASAHRQALIGATSHNAASLWISIKPICIKPASSTSKDSSLCTSFLVPPSRFLIGLSSYSVGSLPLAVMDSANTP
ncbi:hypothetical protein C8R44DRAFT_846585 [Mycena epipterygia]|nr:hypothetical protein C8R44DRAFT_846585 [Mycena epipterygia]